MRSERSAAFLAILLLSLSFLARPAAAQPAPSSDTLAELLRTAAAAAASREYEACAAAYTAALARDRAATTAGELALCEEALGRHVAAYDHLVLAFEGEPAPAHGDPTADPWPRFRAAFERVKARLARTIVFVDRNDAEVFLDGRSLGTHVNGRYFALTPGEHTWLARLGGRRATFAHRVRAGDLPTVHLLFGPSAGTAPAPIEEPPCVAARNVRMSPDLCALIQDMLRDRMDPTLQFFGGGLLSLGLTADVGPGFFAGGAAHWRRTEDLGFHVGFEVQALMPTKAFTRSTGQPLDLSFVLGAITPCARYWWISGCAVLDAGVSIAGGPGPLSFPGPPIKGMLGMGPRLAIDIPIVERFGVRVFGDVRFSPLADANGFFEDEAPSNRWANPLVVGRLGLGVYFQ